MASPHLQAAHIDGCERALPDVELAPQRSVGVSADVYHARELRVEFTALRVAPRDGIVRRVERRNVVEHEHRPRRILRADICQHLLHARVVGHVVRVPLRQRHKRISLEVHHVEELVRRAEETLDVRHHNAPRLVLAVDVVVVGVDPDLLRLLDGKRAVSDLLQDRVCLRIVVVGDVAAVDEDVHVVRSEEVACSLDEGAALARAVHVRVRDDAGLPERRGRGAARLERNERARGLDERLTREHYVLHNAFDLTTIRA